MLKNRIAFVYYPYGHQEATFDTMPFAFNAVIQLAKSGWPVDLFLWERDQARYDAFLPSTVRIRTVKEFNSNSLIRFDLPSRLNRLREIRLWFRMRALGNYCCVFGVGQLGLCIADRIAASNNCPIIYFNDEFPSHWPTTVWTRLEREAAQRVSLVVVPDECRFEPLCFELSIGSSKPFAVLPNLSNVPPAIPVGNWHERLNIPNDKFIFAIAGTLGDWAQVPEVLMTLPHWPEETILVLHSRSGRSDKYRKELRHLDVPGKLIWTNAKLTDSDLNSFVSHCTGTIALYRNTGPNIEYMGKSSGKIMRSVYCGTPVIATDFPSLSFVQKHGVGIMVTHPREIPHAVSAIIENAESFSRRCRSFVDARPTFDASWRAFCQASVDATGIDLSNAKQDASERS